MKLFLCNYDKLHSPKFTIFIFIIAIKKNAKEIIIIVLQLPLTNIY